MKAKIISIENAILMKNTLNLNAQILAKKLDELGICLNSYTSMKNNFNEVFNEIKNSILNNDILFILGLDNENHLKNKIIENIIENIIDKKNSNNKIIIEIDGKKIFLLPSNSIEFELIIDDNLSENLKNNLIIKSFNIINIKEKEIKNKIKDINLNDNKICINIYNHLAYIEIKIIANEWNEIVSNELERISNYLYMTFNKNIYSTDNETPIESLVKRLINQNLKISFAESITGGLLASKITSVPNASKILYESLVTYSHEAKMKDLGVLKNTLDRFGAVSEETAYEMAKGLYKRGMCDIAVSVTGEAGPIPAEKKVGEVYACYYFKDKFKVKKYNFEGYRNLIQEKTADTIINHLILNLS